MGKVTLTKLTEREFDILYLITNGYSNQEIGTELEISKHTVKAHVESIYRKFGVHNKVQATIYAIYHRIIDIEELKTSLPIPPLVENIETDTVEHQPV